MRGNNNECTSHLVLLFRDISQTVIAQGFCIWNCFGVGGCKLFMLMISNHSAVNCLRDVYCLISEEAHIVVGSHAALP